MRTRFALLLAAILLLTVAAAGAAQTVPAGAPASPEAFIASLGCDAAPAAANLSAAPVAPARDAAPARMSLVVVTCGSCSANPCKGAVYNSSCSSGTRIAKCLSPLGTNCSDGTFQCQCWSGPLP